MVHAMLEGIMKTITQEDVLEAISRMTTDQMRAVLIKTVKARLSPSMRSTLNELIMGSNDRPVAPVGEDRAIPLREIQDLANSEMTKHIDYIILAALKKPMQTRELMLEVMAMEGKKLFYLTPEGVSKKHKTQVGYILSMAGFERMSHYDRETKKPVKAWKPNRGTVNMTASMRSEMVRSILVEYTGHAGQSLVTHLEDLV